MKSYNYQSSDGLVHQRYVYIKLPRRLGTVYDFAGFPCNVRAWVREPYIVVDKPVTCLACLGELDADSTLED